MKLTLVSIQINGKIFSKFMMLDGEKPKVAQKELFQGLPMGLTVTVDEVNETPLTTKEL